MCPGAGGCQFRARHRMRRATLTVEEIQIVKEHLVAFGREDQQGNPVEEFGERVHFGGRRAFSPSS